MELVAPTVEYKDSFIDAVLENATETDASTQHYHSTPVTELRSNFDAFVEREKSHARGENLKPGYVPQSDFWLIDSGRYIGRASIRHTLNEHLLQIGGHIGYDIRPSERGKGYGNSILALALPEAKKLGINRALLTCDATNVASRKVIEKNGGVLENQVQNPETGVDKLRFWIDIE